MREDRGWARGDDVSQVSRQGGLGAVSPPNPRGRVGTLGSIRLAVWPQAGRWIPLSPSFLTLILIYQKIPFWACHKARWRMWKSSRRANMIFPQKDCSRKLCEHRPFETDLVRWYNRFVHVILLSFFKNNSCNFKNSLTFYKGWYKVHVTKVKSYTRVEKEQSDSTAVSPWLSFSLKSLCH